MTTAGIEKDVFGTTSDGSQVDRYTLRNARGLTARIITYGATITELFVPDRDGNLDDVVLGFDNLTQYETESPYFGCVPGRLAFRIAEGRFTLDGKSYQLTLNTGRHHLHGGVQGFHKAVWDAEPLDNGDEPAVRFTHLSPDGDQGYPGNLRASVTIAVTDDNELTFDFSAETDQATPAGLTHHGYFNLAGAGRGTILDHILQLDAGQYTPTDEEVTPTGDFAPVQGTPFDFTHPTAIGSRIEESGGYDLSYLRDAPSGSVARVATVSDPTTGRTMEVLADAPALIFYSGNALDGTLKGKEGKKYPQHSGLCLETGHLPDAVHHTKFPSVILRPGETYRHRCVYRFLND